MSGDLASSEARSGIGPLSLMIERTPRTTSLRPSWVCPRRWPYRV